MGLIPRGFCYAGKEERTCRKCQTIRAAIRGVRTSCRADRSTANSTKHSIRTMTVSPPADEATAADGRGQDASSFRVIRSARSVLSEEDTRRLRSLTIAFLIEVIRSSSGTGATGRHSANPVTIRRPGTRTAIRLTRIDGGGEGRFTSLR